MVWGGIIGWATPHAFPLRMQRGKGSVTLDGVGWSATGAPATGDVLRCALLAAGVCPGIWALAGLQSARL